MQYRIKAVEVLRLDVAHVDAQRLNVMAVRTEKARLEEVGVETDDLMTGPFEDRDEHRPDVAVVTSDENAQETSMAYRK
jgi:hypothetical protein